ncbi:hypothetical protein CQW49_14445 [Methylosinus trichosporium OB3b]|uniref:Uncharacterized protein n=1 Tax=Methylosinus trichosporium (strain ATCC 35070 / NCIMB 11131 / UNIQEM 75 / OB3b) TaxID=595536 RepID=A0A2D2D1T3_METT3|nr:hypothetical protein CQW49_14445 [Methylosinus trichosporium OB3b]OBS52262.1 hypothetical protein A8B73_11740 [Methylosinus sp. 3S-1]
MLTRAPFDLHRQRGHDLGKDTMRCCRMTSLVQIVAACSLVQSVDALAFSRSSEFRSIERIDRNAL